MYYKGESYTRSHIIKFKHTIDGKNKKYYLKQHEINDIDLELVDAKGRLIFKLGAMLLKEIKSNLYYDAINVNNKLRYIENEKYYDVNSRPEKFLEDKNLISLNFSVSEWINEVDFLEYYVWKYLMLMKKKV